jgi:hypothetical protein
VVDLPTERRAGCPVGRTEGTNDKQDHDGYAAEFCAGTKTRFQIGAHGNTFSHPHKIIVAWATPQWGNRLCIPRFPVKRCGDMIRLTSYLATLEMMKRDFWKAINTHRNDRRSGTD